MLRLTDSPSELKEKMEALEKQAEAMLERKEWLQCPVCLSGIRAKSEKEAESLLVLHARLAHPEIKENVGTWRYYS